MGNKNKTVSFRVNEETFEELRQVAEQEDLSLSAVFRDYVDTFVAHDGQVRVVPEEPMGDAEDGFPPTVEVPTSFIRDHERLELEAEHLREQLEEYKRYVNALREELEADEDVVYLEDLDEELAGDEPYQFG
ncbi:MAG: CopG family transcriptional regulator [Halobacteriales archaeon]